MLRARTPLLRSAYDELVVVGSRWTRLCARRALGAGGYYGAAGNTRRGSGKSSSNSNSNSAAAAALLFDAHDAHHIGGDGDHGRRSEDVATSCVTVIPTLHVASIAFYDRVLEYVQQAIRRNPNVVVLLEGVCDSAAAAAAQMAEYCAIAADAGLRDTLLRKADTNTLYTAEVMREICAELKVNYDVLARLEATVRLQDCYLKPKMAALCGRQLRNDADLNLREVKQLLEEEAARLASLGELPPSSVSVSELGTFPLVRACRERKVARVARQLCEQWAATRVEGEVIVPWGYYHTEAIVHCLLEGNSTAAAATMYTTAPLHTTSAAATATPTAAAHANDTATPAVAADGDACSPPPPRVAATADAAAAPVDGSRDVLTTTTVVHTEPVIFVPSDEVLAKVAFGLPPEALLDTTLYHRSDSSSNSNSNDSSSAQEEERTATTTTTTTTTAAHDDAKPLS